MVFGTTADTMATMLAKGADGGVPFGQSNPFLSFINSATCYANSSILLGTDDDASNFQQKVLADLDNSVAKLIPSQDPGVIEGYKALYKANAQNILMSPVGQVELLLYATGNLGGGDQTISIQLALQHPFSQGRLYITTNDAFDDPAIDPQYLSHWADVQLLRQGVKLARTFAATSPLSGVLTGEVAPGTTITTDDAIDAYVANDITTEFHPANTLAMLPLAQGGVVDAKLKIYGLQNVRCVDASIFPVQFAAHVSPLPSRPRHGIGIDLAILQMQWPVYSLAEHGSEIIRAFHNGVPDPDDSNPAPGNNGGGNNNNTGNNGHNGAAFSSSTPSLLTSVVALFLAAATIL